MMTTEPTVPESSALPPKRFIPWWQKLLLTITGLLGVLLLVALALPSTWSVERSIVVQAPPETIFPYLADLKRWQEWTVWNSTQDPSAKYSYTGPASGAGASMEWQGEKLGDGKLSLLAADTKMGIQYSMTMESQKTPARGEVRMSPEATGTRVTWVDRGDMGGFLPGRYVIAMLTTKLEDDFERGLANLKRLAEGQKVP